MTDKNPFDLALFATLAGLVGIWLSIIGLYFAVPKGKNRFKILVLANAGTWIIVNAAIFLSVSPQSTAVNTILMLNLVLIMLLIFGSIVYFTNIRQLERISWLPKPMPQSLQFGLNHIDNVIIPYYVSKANVTVNDKRDAMSDVLRQISLTTVPSSIENLARIGLFEVRDKGRFRILAAHHIDAHRLPKLERTFSYPTNSGAKGTSTTGLVGEAVVRRHVIHIPNLDQPPDVFREKYLVTEDNKLPGQKAESIVCIPVFDTTPVTDSSKCLAVLSISCSQRNFFTGGRVGELQQYAERIRTLLIALNSRTLIDPDVSYGVRAITISGEVASGKTTLVAELRGILQAAGWRVVSIGERFRAFCELRGITVQQLEQLPIEIHKQFDEYQLSMLKEEELIIVEGRLSGYLARELSDVLTVFCYLPLEERVKRIAERGDVSLDEARQAILNRDQKDLERYRNLYEIEDYRKPEFYKLYLTTDERPFLLAQKVIEAITKFGSR